LPTLIIAEPFFSIPAAVTPMVQDNVVAEPVVNSPISVVATPIVGSPMAEVEEVEPVFQEPIANHEEEQQDPPI
jgi:hypothetical protein